MEPLAAIDRRRVARAAVAVVAALALVTLVVGALESAGLHDASTVYLLAVVAVAVVAGTWPAVVTAFGAFLAYDLLFVEPRATLTVDDPQEWLNLLVLLVVGIVVGRLAGRERERAETAIEREREATAMFRTSFELAAAATPAALPVIADVLAGTVGGRVWIEVGERTVADSASGPRPIGAVHTVLVRRPGDEPAVWTLVHAPASGPVRAGAAGERGSFHRIAVTAGDRSLGSIWVERRRPDGVPTPGETRVLAAAADQVGRALERDRLAADAAAAEVARRSDALKSALLDSVSHDLRTPLASIRAAAGTLMDPAVERTPSERLAIAAAIDGEAERLNRLVANLLDMSRIEAGELRPTTSAFVLEDLVEAALRRSAISGDDDRLTLDLSPELPPVEVDDVLFDQVLGNLLDNIQVYAGDRAPIVIRGRSMDDRVALTVEDGGPGVPDEALPRLFEKFYRAPRGAEGSRRGTGAGLAVVHGLVTAMGGAVSARRSDLGGLAIDVTVPAAPRPAELAGPVPGGTA